MKRGFLAVLIVLIVSVSFLVSAETYTINIKGEPRTPDGNFDTSYNVGLATDQGTIPSDNTVNNEQGYFEIRNAVLNTNASFNYVAVWVQGTCVVKNFEIFRVGDHFEVSDGYDTEHKVLISTKDTNIDLGIIREDKSNQVMIDLDIPVSLLIEDTNGNWKAERGCCEKIGGSFGAFSPNTEYKLILTDKSGDKWEKTITTGGYCEGTRVIKRGSRWVIEKSQNNSFLPIGFFRNIWLSILGFRMIVIIPLLILILVIILILYFIFRKRSSPPTFQSNRLCV